MRVAVIGGGIAGIAAAYHVQPFAHVTLYEARAVLGGHTDTHNLFVDDRTYAVDSGFIVFNTGNYPLFSRWLDDLGVASKRTVMSFGVSMADGLEYGTTGLKALFCQPRNLARSGFLAMLGDIRRFYRRARELGGDRRTLGEFVADEGYSSTFIEAHLLPMCAALWSAPRERVTDMAIAHIAAFMSNHGLVELRNRPQWRVVDGGSSSYLEAFESRFRGRIRHSCPVRHVVRDSCGANVHTDTDIHRFDYVIFACHSDDALRLVDPTPVEAAVLGAIRYGTNKAVVHSDSSVMPRSRDAWSSWNVNANRNGEFQFTYWMNRLQGIGPEQQFFVTLNPTGALDSAWVERDYRHPIFDLGALTAQRRHAEVDTGRTRYCGAYWGWGFHEDAFRSGYEAARQIEGGAAFNVMHEAMGAVPQERSG